MKKISSNCSLLTSVIIILTISGQYNLHAQAGGGFSLNPNISFNVQSLPPSDLKEQIVGAEAGDDIPSLEFRTLNLEVSYPVVLSTITIEDNTIPTKILFNNFLYHNSQNKFQSLPFQSQHLNTENFEAIGYNALYIQMFSKKWSMIGFLGASLAVDEFGDASVSDLNYQGALGFDRRLDSGWTVGLGIIVSQLTGQTAILPLIHIATGSEKMSFEILGLKASFWYTISSKLRLGIEAELSGMQYTFASINKNDNEKTPLHDKNGNVINDDVDIALAHSQVTLGPVLVIPLSSHFNIKIEGGLVTGRRFEFFKLGDNKTLRWGEGDGTSLPEGAYGEKQEFNLKTGIYAEISAQIGF
jgi:hypothetical protein